MMCPCCSGVLYEDCCQPFHQHKLNPPTAVALMRSRYSAYAKALTDYIIETTHPENPCYQANLNQWTKDLRKFSQLTQFLKLEIIECEEMDENSFVTFVAHLKQGDRDVSFIEKSCFVKLNGRWLYFKGEVHPI